MEGSAWRSAEAGVTLVELMVALVLSLVLMAAVYLMYQSQSSSAASQGQVSQMQQDLRLVKDVMERDIRMTGLDPANSDSFGIVTPAAQALTVSLDLDGDGTLDPAPAGELVRYALSGTKLTRQDGTAAAATLAEHVTTLGFAYLDRNGATTVTAASIRTVVVNLGLRSARPEPETGAYLDRRLERRIRCRNLGL